jgi:D-beta-D-heptose 7-phosphate kinase/D-beta-D-heptose 1-phosphate adenosyltransferase
MTGPAHIIDLEDFSGIRDNLGKIVATSGGYDPIHPGHTSCLLESKKFGDSLIVIVNGDGYLRRKKGRAFMNLQTRCRIVSCIKGVEYVIPFEYNDDDSVCEALRIIRPHVFTKGGDRTDLSNIPEWHICEENKIEIITGVGVDKAWSSYDYLKDWGEYWAEKPDKQI